MGFYEYGVPLGGNFGPFEARRYSVLKTKERIGSKNEIRLPITSALSELLMSLVIPQDSHQLSSPQPGSSRYSFRCVQRPTHI